MFAASALEAADTHKAPEGEDYYDKLGVTKIINAAGTYTALTASTCRIMAAAIWIQLLQPPRLYPVSRRR